MKTGYSSKNMKSFDIQHTVTLPVEGVVSQVWHGVLGKALEYCQGDFALAFQAYQAKRYLRTDRKSTRLNSSHVSQSRMPSSA